MDPLSLLDEKHGLHRPANIKKQGLYYFVRHFFFFFFFMDKNKSHRKSKTGAKVNKKKTGQSGNNPKAFTFKSAQRAEKTARRNMDLGEKKLHVPQIDRTPHVPPPLVVAVVGPSGVIGMDHGFIIRRGNRP
jgi:hypothetical protein